MRSLLLVCVLVCVALMACTVNAAAPDQVSDSALAAMGLNNMQPMSDAQGAEVRGLGFASVSGTNFATMFGSASLNSYNAASRTRGALATGASISAVIAGGATYTGVVMGGATGVIAVGGAVAYAR